MKASLWPAGRNARLIGAAAALLLATRVLGAQSAATSRRLSCASSLERGKDLLDRRQFRQAEELLVRAAGVCPSVAEIFDTLGLALLCFVLQPEEKHFVDITENSFFWYFVIITWIPLYLIVFLGPRW